jgi:hypothetical protein
MVHDWLEHDRSILSVTKEFPPRQTVGSFGIDQVLESLQSGGAKAN